VLAPAGVAALALVLALPWLMHRSTDSRLAQEVVSAHIRSLMADHLTDVASTDQHTVKPWFTGKVTFSPPVADLAAQGFPLVGGRLDVLKEQPVAALVYQRRKHFINLFIWPSTRTVSAREQSLSQRGYNLVHWIEDGMDCWAVSDVNGADLQEFMQAVRRGK
jgi:anti-sigma factor RsiW